MPGKKLSNYFHFATTESFGRMLTLNEITGLNIPPNSVTRKIHAVMEKRMNMYNWKKKWHDHSKYNQPVPWCSYFCGFFHSTPIFFSMLPFFFFSKSSSMSSE